MDSKELVEAALSDSIPSTLVEPGTPGTPATPMARVYTDGMGDSGDKPKPSRKNKKNPCDEPVHFHEPLSRALLDDFLNKCKKQGPTTNDHDDGSFEDATTEELPGRSPIPELPEDQPVLGYCEGEESAFGSPDPLVDCESGSGGSPTQKTNEMLDLVESSDEDSMSESEKKEPDLEPPVSSVSDTSDSGDMSSEDIHTAATWQIKRCFRSSRFHSTFRRIYKYVSLPQNMASKKSATTIHHNSKHPH